MYYCMNLVNDNAESTSQKIKFSISDFFSICDKVLKGFVRYIFASLFFMSKREDFRNKEKYFLFHFVNSFCS